MSIKNDQQLIEWLQLIRTDSVGPVTFWQLLRRYGSAELALQELSGISRYSKKPLVVFSKSQALDEIDRHHARGFHLLPAFHSDFPKDLKQLPDCPPVISVYGNTSVFNASTVAIVGARNASLSGRQFAEKLATDLGKAGWIIASGLARGIDKHAHFGGLQTGTVAVIAGGVDVIYPPEHERLYHAIKDHGGAVISEMPLSLHPGASHFPRRNRIISGLSQGVIVIEAAQRSGSLITARYAAEQNRDLFSVPGSPLDPRCRGTNDLLRQGAHLVESASDVLSVLESSKIFLKEQTYPFAEYPVEVENDSDIREEILTDLSAVPVDIDFLISQHACRVQDIRVILLDLELTGVIQRHSNGTVSRVFKE